MQLLFILFLLVTPVKKKVDVSLKLEVGKTYTHSYYTDMDINQSINGMDQNVKMTLNGGMQYVVESFDDGVYTLKTSYTSLNMTMGSAFANIEMSSEEGEGTTPFSNILHPLVNKEFTAKIDKYGNAIEVKGVEDLFASMVENFPQIPEAQKQQLITQIKQAYGESAFKSQLESNMAIYPKEKVSVGDTWETQIEMANNTGVANNTITLVNMDKEFYYLEVSTKIITAENNEFNQVNGMPTRYALSGSGKSTYKLDAKTNWIMEVVQDQDIEGEVEIGDNQMIPGGMSIPMTIKSKTTLSGK